LGVAFLLSQVFQLRTLNWAMKWLFTYGVFVVIVLFQPELRRAIEKIGRNPFKWSWNTQDNSLRDRIDEIVKAANYMSLRKIGALIVFERQTGLSDYIEALSSTQIEARISSQLLNNIFVPNTPLHDGAVIIRGNQIMAAGCYLPLSDNPFISKELGTRHRAGIGITEVSDAVTLIVSEETGQISIAIEGMILRDIKGEALIEKLFDLLNYEAQDGKVESSVKNKLKKLTSRKKGGDQQDG
jgi:diadenylate cyclase